jgi:hypothetical protein
MAQEKIYGWQYTPLSLARFYGGCKFNGHEYWIDVSDPKTPLVRADIFKAEQKESKTKKSNCNRENTYVNAELFLYY